MLARLVCLALLIGCGGVRGGTPTTEPKPKRGIEAAALPYSVLDRTGRQLDAAAFWAQVDASRVVCVGEDHPNPHHHWFQLEVMKHVAGSKKPLALGLEMFQRPFQGVLDDFSARRIDEAALLSRSGYAERWGYDYGFYGPTINTAVGVGAALLALNTPRELTKKVVRQGLESLTPEEKKQMPDLVLDDKTHRAWFDETMESIGGAHGHGDKKGAKESNEGKEDDKPKAEMPSMDRIYTAQVMWDEFMADGAARWARSSPQGLLVLLAGNGHCHDSAIINRVKRRGVDKAISLVPVVDIEGRVAEALAKPKNDYIIVLSLPADIKAKMEKR
jgi:uncharacterized iron-regulated protein